MKNYTLNSAEMRLMGISSDWFALLCIVLSDSVWVFDRSALILAVLVLSMGAQWAYTRLEAPQSIISDNNVRWSKIF